MDFSYKLSLLFLSVVVRLDGRPYLMIAFIVGIALSRWGSTDIEHHARNDDYLQASVD
jgi:hypothetical protein